MQIIAISGDGNGAGKSTLALKLADSVWSLASALREELVRKYPGYEWHNKSQTYKNLTRVGEVNGMTVREVMIKHGQDMCQADPTYYVRKLTAKLQAVSTMATGARRVAIDDIRKVVELDYLRDTFSTSLLHYHVVNPNAVFESEFDNEQLASRADYLISWVKP